MGCEPAPRDQGRLEAVRPGEVEPTRRVLPAPLPPSEAPSSSSPARTVETPPAPVEPARVEPIEVAHDRGAWVVRAADHAPPHIVFLPGICSNAGAYLMGFPETARAHGGVVAVDGDKPCGHSTDFHSISSDAEHEEPRIRAALSAAGWGETEPTDIVLVGYSLGATLIENLVQKHPDRYSKVVLIGSPRDPRLDRLKSAKRVATMSCSLDVPARMKGAAKTLAPAGVSVAYFEMPGCTHGNLAEGERVMAEALDWVLAP